MGKKRAGKSTEPKISERANANLSVSPDRLQPLSLKSRLNAASEHKKPFEIKDRYSGRVLFETEAETLKDALEEAVMSSMNLSCADLRNADLREACLANANLSNADFSGASLFKTVLHRSNLIGTRFCNVDLRGADIRYASLKKAVLQNSDLRVTDFMQSDLTQADFRNSKLEDASLRGANITSTYFDPRPKAPEKGSFVGWKKVYDEHGTPLIVELLIPEDAQRTTPLFGRVHRAEFVKVLEFSRDVSFAKGRFYPEIYRVGEIMRLGHCYDSDVQIGNTRGFHFFLTREEAEQDRWGLPFVPTAEYWKSAIYRELHWVQKHLNISWPFIEHQGLQKGLNHQTFFVHRTPINSMSRALEFYLNNAGHTVVPAKLGFPSTTEGHPQEYTLSWEKGRILQEFQVVYITKGKGVFQSTQGGLIPINAGDALLLSPGEWHRYRPDPEVGWAQFWIRFGGDYANKLMSSEPLSSLKPCLLYTSPSPRDRQKYRMPSSA